MAEPGSIAAFVARLEALRRAPVSGAARERQLAALEREVLAGGGPRVSVSALVSALEVMAALPQGGGGKTESSQQYYLAVARRLKAAAQGSAMNR